MFFNGTFKNKYTGTYTKLSESKNTYIFLVNYFNIDHKKKIMLHIKK